MFEQKERSLATLLLLLSPTSKSPELCSHADAQSAQKGSNHDAPRGRHARSSLSSADRGREVDDDHDGRGVSDDEVVAEQMAVEVDEVLARDRVQRRDEMSERTAVGVEVVLLGCKWTSRLAS